MHDKEETRRNKRGQDKERQTLGGARRIMPKKGVAEFGNVLAGQHVY